MFLPSLVIMLTVSVQRTGMKTWSSDILEVWRKVLTIQPLLQRHQTLKQVQVKAGYLDKRSADGGQWMWLHNP